MHPNQTDAAYAGAELRYAVLGQFAEQPPARAARFDAPANNLEELNKGLAEMSARLYRVADRLGGSGGSTPEPVEKKGEELSAGSVAGRYERIASTYSTLMRKLSTTVERLEQL